MLFKKSKKIDDGRSIYVKKSRTQEVWHQFKKNKGAVVGLIMLIISAFVQIPFMYSSDDVVGTMTLVLETVQVTALVCSIIPVEAELKKRFDQDGKRKQEQS